MSVGLPPTGSLRESVRFERRPIAGQGDGYGNEAVANFAPILTGISARISPMNGSERMIAQGLQAVADSTIWVRGSSEANAILPSDRIVNERTGTIYNIRYIDNPDERGRFRRMIAETGVAT